jgi:hypothetical protein
MAKVQERLDKHDRQIAAMRELVRDGIRLVMENRKDIRALTLSQKRTEALLQSYLSSLQRGNGHGKSKADVQ